MKIQERANGIRDLAHIKAACETWARWCCGSRQPGGVSPTGRLMLGVSGNICPGWLDDVSNGRGHDPWCPLCHGTGKLPLSLTAERRTVTRCCPVCENEKDRRESCHRCRGAGRVTIVTAWVNPASIRSTAPPGQDWQSWMIDDLVTGWREHDRTFWMNRVVVREYFHNGTQAMKAHRMGVSAVWYNKRLLAAYRSIGQAIFESMPRG